MSSQISLETNIDMQKERGLCAILGKRQDTSSFSQTSLSELWGLSSYDLDQSRFFQSLDEQIQRQCLEDLAFSRLEEAVHIEKAGMAYTAKMALLAETLEERRMYSLFSSDEAKHLGFLERIVSLDRFTTRENAFLDLLDEMICHGRKRPLIFIIQVLLEGWGIEHYQKLTRDCQFEPFGDLLEQIVRDEAGHHGSGLVLFDENDLSQEEKEEIREALVRFFEFVRIGPVGLLKTVSTQVNLSRDKARTLLREINAQEQTQKKIQTLKRMMKKSSASDLIDFVETRQADRVFSEEEMLNVIH